MTEEEKILALQLLLQDMRGSFPLEGYGDVRMVEAKKLADELGFKAHSDSIQELADDDYRDGRHFRTSVENGGYEGMDSLHNLPSTFHDKSEEFRRLMTATLQFPEYIFSDWRN